MTPINDLATDETFTATAGQTVFALPCRLFPGYEGAFEVTSNGTKIPYDPAGGPGTFKTTATGTEGVTITLANAAGAGDTVRCRRVLPCERLTGLPEAGPVSIKTVNDELTRIVALVQDRAPTREQMDGIDTTKAEVDAQAAAIDGQVTAAANSATAAANSASAAAGSATNAQNSADAAANSAANAAAVAGFDPNNFILASAKGAANGVAPLDGSAKVPAANLPSYVDDVLEYANLAAFPGTGTAGIIYVADDTNKQYRWTGTQYIQLVASPGTTDNVPEGTTNLYHTDARVRGCLLTGYAVAGANAAIAATDSILVAFGKAQKQISDLQATGSGWNYTILAADYTGTTAGAEDTGLTIDVTGWAANSVYEIELHAMCKVTAGTFIVGLVGPTTSASAAAYLQAINGTQAINAQGEAVSATIALAGVNSATFVNVIGQMLVITGAVAPTGAIKLQIRDGSGGGTHTVGKGSFIKYRKIA